MQQSETKFNYMKKNVKTMFTAEPWKGQVFTMPSLTVPDESLSVKEIMARYANGLPLGGQKVPVYHGEEFVPDMERLDLSEKHELLQENAARIKAMQDDLVEQTRKPRKKEQPPKDQDDKPAE